VAAAGAPSKRAIVPRSHTTPKTPFSRTAAERRNPEVADRDLAARVADRMVATSGPSSTPPPACGRFRRADDLPSLSEPAPAIRHVAAHDERELLAVARS